MRETGWWRQGSANQEFCLDKLNFRLPSRAIEVVIGCTNSELSNMIKICKVETHRRYFFQVTKGYHSEREDKKEKTKDRALESSNI